MSSSNPIVLTFYTNDSLAYRYASPKKTSEFKPQWFKDLPVLDDSCTDESNMRFCTGFNSLFNKGAVLPLWSDVVIDLGRKGDTDYSWYFANRQSSAVIHPPYQRGSYLPETDYSHLKLASPWCAVCDEKVEFMFTSNVWMSDMPEDLIIPNGVINFDVNHSLHVNMFVKRHDEPRRVMLNAMQPTVQLIPISDRDLEIKVELVDDTKFKFIQDSSSIISFQKSHYKKRSAKHDSGCPFLSK